MGMVTSCMLIGFYAIFTVGCTGLKSDNKNQMFEKWRIRAEESKGYSPSKRKRSVRADEVETTRAKPPADAQTLADQRLPKKRITLKMHQTDIAVLLRALARAVDQNVIISENVKGAISINIKQVPWDQTFLGILKTQGLSYDFDGEILRIITLDDRKNDLAKLEAESQIKAKKRELALVEPLIHQVVDIDYADAAELKTNLEKFLTEKTEGKPLGAIMVDEHTNSLIIQAMRDDFKIIISLIEDLDRPTSQIHIEAHIVEATSETARDLGIQWGGLHDGGNAWLFPGANSTGVLGETLSTGGINPTSNFAVNFPAALSDGFGLTLGAAVEDAGRSILAAQLSALQREGKLNILSSPSITTLDNQAAVIESGDEVPFQTVSDGEVQVEYKKAVLSLKVTPHVIQGDTLKLTIATSKDELDFTRTVGGNPTIITKKAETNVILFNGQTTVIGGLNKETDNKAEAGIPGLKDIPFFGYFFKGESLRNKMEEVLIFITPHILEEKEAM